MDINELATPRLFRKKKLRLPSVAVIFVLLTNFLSRLLLSDVTSRVAFIGSDPPDK